MIRPNIYLAAALLISGLYAFFIGGLLPYLLFFTLIIAGIVSIAYLILGYTSLKVSIEYNDRIYYAGDTESFRTLVGCNLTLPYVDVSGTVLALSQLHSRDYRGSISFTENLLLQNTITFHQRGIYNLGKLTLTLKDIFNFCRVRRDLKEKIIIKVYPRIYRIKQVSLIARDIYLEKSDMFSNNADPFTVRDIRKYRRGDSLKKIHWKVSARFKKLYVKNQETISGEDIALFVDFHNKNYSYDTKGITEERVADCAISIIDYLVDNHIDIDIYLNTLEDNCFTINEPVGYEHFTEFITRTKSDGKLEFGEYVSSHLFKLNKMNRIFMITAAIDDSLTSHAIKIKNSGFQIHIIPAIPPGDHLRSTLKNHGIQVTDFDNLFVID